MFTLRFNMGKTCTARSQIYSRLAISFDDFDAADTNQQLSAGLFGELLMEIVSSWTDVTGY